MKYEMFYGFEYTFTILDELRIVMEEYSNLSNIQRIKTKLKGLTPILDIKQFNQVSKN